MYTGKPVLSTRPTGRAPGELDGSRAGSAWIAGSRGKRIFPYYFKEEFFYAYSAQYYG